MLLALTFFAVSVKINALTTLPFVGFLWGCLLFGNTKKRIAFAGFLTVFIALAFVLFNLWIHPTATHRFQQMQLNDLMRMSYYLHHLIFPNYILHNHPEITLTLIQQNFPQQPSDDWFSLHYGLTTQNVQLLQQLTHYWLQMILKHPIAYLHARSALFLQQLSIGYLHITPHLIIITIGCALPWMYCASTLIATYLGFRFEPRIKQYIICMCLIFYSFLLPHFFVAPAAEYRYLYFIIMLAIILFPISLLEYFQYRHEPIKGSNIK